MNFAAMLLRAPVISKPTSKRPYVRRSTNVRKPNTEARYRLYLENTKRSIPELAERLGYGYDGTRSTVLRMLDRGLVKEAGHGDTGRNGRKPMLYTWIK